MIINLSGQNTSLAVVNVFVYLFIPTRLLWWLRKRQANHQYERRSCPLQNRPTLANENGTRKGGGLSNLPSKYLSFDNIQLRSLRINPKIVIILLPLPPPIFVIDVNGSFRGLLIPMAPGLSRAHGGSSSSFIHAQSKYVSKQQWQYLLNCT